MNLIETYVYEVTRRLPEKTRVDIALELRSTIEDMLPEDYIEQDVKQALTKLGDPARLAASYRDTPMHLIGPKVYDAYIWTMKMIVPWAILITILVHIVETIILFSGEESILSVMIKSFGIIIGNVIHVLIQTFFWVTIVFVFIERIGLAKSDLPMTKYGTKWTPNDLKYVHVIPRKKAISKGEIIFGFVWTALWAVIYFNADHLIGIYRSIDGSGLQMVMPIFNQSTLLSYWPLFLPLVAMELGLWVYKWKERQWTIKLMTLNAVIKTFSLIVIIIIATNPALINDDLIPYLANLLEISLSSVNNIEKWAVWSVVITIIVTTAIEIYESYRKAKK